MDSRVFSAPFFVWEFYVCVIFFSLADCPVMAYCAAMMNSVGALEEIYDYARFDVRPFLTILCGRKSGSNVGRFYLCSKFFGRFLESSEARLHCQATNKPGRGEGGVMVRVRFIALLTDIKTDSI